jgi:hypothetical protein
MDANMLVLPNGMAHQFGIVVQARAAPNENKPLATGSNIHQPVPTFARRPPCQFQIVLNPIAPFFHLAHAFARVLIGEIIVFQRYGRYWSLEFNENPSDTK